MVHLVISDIHEDHLALRNALATAEEAGGYDDIWFLGDALGHRLDDNEDPDAVIRCLSLLREKKAICVSGNWEGWFFRPEEDRNPPQNEHRTVLESLRQRLPPNVVDYVKSWDWLVEIKMAKEGFSLTHGCTFPGRDYLCPVTSWETYIWPTDTLLVDQIFSWPEHKIATQHLVVGHTHVPGYFHYNDDHALWYPVTSQSVDQDQRMDSHGGRYVLNPGSVASSGDSSGFPTALLLNTTKRAFRFLRIDHKRRP